MVNPFYASEAAGRASDPWFVERTIVLAFGVSGISVILAYLLSQARLIVDRNRRETRR
jgi:hypothetical protein